VDDAVSQQFGSSVNIAMIGAQMTGDGNYPTLENPSEDGHYWKVPGSEGAMVTLPNSLFHRSIDFSKE
jgi:hypothetical protein